MMATDGKILAKVISGGQIGADRAALDWAINHGIDHGGWCPKGRKADNEVIPEKYQLQETKSANYDQRTRQNVLNSDGTLILNTGELDGGSLKTKEVAEKNNKPCLVVQLDKNIGRNLGLCTAEWIRANKIGILNIAGPLESKCRGIGCNARMFLENLVNAERIPGQIAPEAISKNNTISFQTAHSLLNARYKCAIPCPNTGNLCRDSGNWCRPSAKNS